MVDVLRESLFLGWNWIFSHMSCVMCAWTFTCKFCTWILVGIQIFGVPHTKSSKIKMQQTTPKNEQGVYSIKRVFRTCL